MKARHITKSDPIIGKPCLVCGRAFAAGDVVTFATPEPPVPTPHTIVVVAEHWLCSVASVPF